MVVKNRTPALIVSSFIVIFGIIHLGVGIGLTARFGKYGDVFRLSVGLSAYNIVIGLFALAVGILALFTIIRERPRLAKPLAIMAIVLGIFAIASFISGLVINSTSIDYIKDRLTYRMTTYNENQDSINTFDNIQTNYGCCGVNLWLDWSRVSLGVSGTSGLGVGRRRRRHSTANSEQSSLPLTPLQEVARQKRQVLSTANNIYNLPISFTFKLPLSCCKTGAITDGNSLGVYCQYSGNISTNTFYVNGCLPPVANDSVSQVTGIVVINTCLAILAFVLLPLLLKMFPRDPNPNNSDDKQSPVDETDQQQQQQEQQEQQQQTQIQYQPQQYMQHPQQPQYIPQQIPYHHGNQGHYMNNHGSTYNTDPAYYYHNNPPAYSTYQ